MIPHEVRALMECFKCWLALGELQHGQEINFAYEHVIKPLQVRGEIERLLQILHHARAKTVLEIGTATGGTLFLFSRHAVEDAVIVSVDLRGGRFGNGYPLVKAPLYRSFARRSQKIVLIRGNSHLEETHRKTREALMQRPVDFLFIDGDHTYGGVRADFEMYSKLVSPGGIIAFHDIAAHVHETGCEVSRYWSEVKHQYRHEEIIENPSQGWAGIGVLYV